MCCSYTLSKQTIPFTVIALSAWTHRHRHTEQRVSKCSIGGLSSIAHCACRWTQAVKRSVKPIRSVNYCTDRSSYGTHTTQFQSQGVMADSVRETVLLLFLSPYVGSIWRQMVTLTSVRASQSCSHLHIHCVQSWVR